MGKIFFFFPLAFHLCVTLGLSIISHPVGKDIQYLSVENNFFHLNP